MRPVVAGDETPEGRSIVVLAKEKYGLGARDIHELGAFIPVKPHERRQFERAGNRKGQMAIEPASQGGHPAAAVSVEPFRPGGTPLVVTEGQRVLGVSSRHCERRDQRTIRRAATHGHQDRDDHR
jgi:K+-transporting ATPase ATPase B chain